MAGNNLKSHTEIPPELAEHVIDVVHEITGSGINIMGRGGIIVSSTEASRVNTIHEGGRRVMSGEVDEVSITEEDASSMTVARAGYMGVVVYNGKRVCCIGIGGEPEKVKPIQKMAAVIITEELGRREEQLKRREVIARISGEVTDISERMSILSLNGSIQAARLGRAGDPFKVVASEMRVLSGEIGKIMTSIESER